MNKILYYSNKMMKLLNMYENNEIFGLWMRFSGFVNF